MKRMLFNATHAEELRVAIVDGQKLLDLDLESAVRYAKKGNIYKGRVTRVEPSLEACFMDYGAEKQGFLPLKEIYRGYFKDYDEKIALPEVKIETVITEGQEMLVQVDKDERDTKGAALTTFISLAGRFLVFMPNNPKGGGISRRITGDDRSELRQILAALSLDPRHSLIVRTEGIGRSLEEMQWDLNFLVRVWDTIEQASREPRAPFLAYQESNLIVRAIRDYLSDDIAEIVIDDEEVHERAHRFISQVMPHKLSRLKLYRDSIPLFSRYQIEGQIASAFNRKVNLPSGGALAIDHTEALISVDVNSARATKGGDIEETALHTNLEAVEELARQLRIRDLGGLVVIDLIDMNVSKNQRVVENRLKEALKVDRARTQIGHISRFGLLEMSRQRLRSSIRETNYRVCPRCDGMGTIRDVVSASLNLLRLLEDEALKENTEAVQVSLPLDMATYLLNEKRHELHQLESRLASRIIIIPNASLTSPHFQLNRMRGDELDEISGIPSFEQDIALESREPDMIEHLKTQTPNKPLVQLDHIASSPIPTAANESEMPPVADEAAESMAEGKRNGGGGRGQARKSPGSKRATAKGGRDHQNGERSPTAKKPRQTRSRRPDHRGSDPAQEQLASGNRSGGRGRGKSNSLRRKSGSRKNDWPAHPGPIISVDIPTDLPDDIGNRK